MTGVSFQMGASLGVPEPQERRIEGVCPAMVMSNTDLLTEGRIQIQVPWLPGYFLWARVAVPMAGMARGTFFIPQVGDEVLWAGNAVTLAANSCLAFYLPRHVDALCVGS